MVTGVDINIDRRRSQLLSITLASRAYERFTDLQLNLDITQS